MLKSILSSAPVPGFYVDISVSGSNTKRLVFNLNHKGVSMFALLLCDVIPWSEISNGVFRRGFLVRAVDIGI